MLGTCRWEMANCARFAIKVCKCSLNVVVQECMDVIIIRRQYNFHLSLVEPGIPEKICPYLKEGH